MSVYEEQCEASLNLEIKLGRIDIFNIQYQQYCLSFHEHRVSLCDTFRSLLSLIRFCGFLCMDPCTYFVRYVVARDLFFGGGPF